MKKQKKNYKENTGVFKDQEFKLKWEKLSGKTNLI